MAGPQDIQRQPLGLLNVLGMQGAGGITPNALAAQVAPTIDMLQFYGGNRQTFNISNAALAEANNVVLNVPLGQTWVLYAAMFSIVKLATTTALRASVFVNDIAVVSEELGPFGATETGTARVCFCAPFPRVLLAGTPIRAVLDILGTDATANCSLAVEVGVLG